MKKDTYFDTASSLLAEGKIGIDVFNAMLDNADAFVEDDDAEECN